MKPSTICEGEENDAESLLVEKELARLLALLFPILVSLHLGPVEELEQTKRFGRAALRICYPQPSVNAHIRHDIFRNDLGIRGWIFQSIIATANRNTSAWTPDSIGSGRDEGRGKHISWDTRSLEGDPRPLTSYLKKQACKRAKHAQAQ